LEEIGVGEGDTVLVHGAPGTVWTITVQLSRGKIVITIL
jgi:NADPH:quinone reductase-like Zn-dependent oxidoreductase